MQVEHCPELLFMGTSVHVEFIAPLLGWQFSAPNAFTGPPTTGLRQAICGNYTMGKGALYKFIRPAAWAFSKLCFQLFKQNTNW